MTVECEVDGMSAVFKILDKQLADIEAAADVEVQAAGIECQAEAKIACPVGTPESTGIPLYKGGRLRSSIKYTPGYLSCTVGTNVEYASFVEEGTKYMKPRPFLHPAFEIARRHLLEELESL